MGVLLRMAFMLGIGALSSLLIETFIVTAQHDPILIGKGEKAYIDKKCGLCHIIKGKGNAKPGPDLSTVGAKREAPLMKAFMKDPKTALSHAKMPLFEGREEELKALVA